MHVDSGDTVRVKPDAGRMTPKLVQSFPSCQVGDRVHRYQPAALLTWHPILIPHYRHQTRLPLPSLETTFLELSSTEQFDIK